MERYDLIILGGGASAFAAATEADRMGLRSVMINAGLPMGGTCVNVGCVPSKHLLALGKSLHHPSRPAFESVGPVRPAFEFAKAMEEKDALVSGLREQNYRQVFGSFRHVEWVEGRGTFVASNVVETAGKEMEGGKILIATGCSTYAPPFEGLKEAGFLTHIEALSLKRLPSSLIVLGVGPLGLEFAQIFSRMGTRVTVVARGKRILKSQEPEISDALRGYMEEEGIEIVTEAPVVRVARTNDGKTVTIETPAGQRTLAAEDILAATGERGNVEGLGLKRIGVATVGDSYIRVNEFLQTDVPHIFAAGDVTGQRCLETVAAKQGKIAVENAFNGANKKIDFLSVPHAVFTDPEAAGVGMTEEQYMAAHGTCNCRTVPLDRVPRAVAVRDTRGLVKMVAHHETGRVMGIHVLAPCASEIIHEATLAVKMGLTVDDLIDTVHVFPTYSEAIKMAAQAFRRDISNMSCCVE
ncbi:MAG: mercury(II) reductase [Deltaproteobacteria bacterium]|nr:mercury(II) reductase [Deltaproteobacteria bacterium]